MSSAQRKIRTAHRVLASAVCTGLTIAALTAPAASARLPIEQQPGAQAAEAQTDRHMSDPAVATAFRTPDDSFDWGSAAVGAGGAGALLLLAAAAGAAAVARPRSAPRTSRSPTSS